MTGLRAMIQGASWSGKERNHLFLNRSGEQFEDLSALSGLDHIADGRVFAVLDLDRDFVDLYNHDLIDIHRIKPESMEAHLHHLRALISQHVLYTDSQWGQDILDDFRTFLPRFWVVKPKATELGSLLDGFRQAA